MDRSDKASSHLRPQIVSGNDLSLVGFYKVKCERTEVHTEYASIHYDSTPSQQISYLEMTGSGGIQEVMYLVIYRWWANREVSYPASHRSRPPARLALHRERDAFSQFDMPESQLPAWAVVMANQAISAKRLL